MKQKDIAKLHGMKKEELTKKLVEATASLAQIAKDRYTKQSKNTRLAKTIRDDIARIKTILRVKELYG